MLTRTRSIKWLCSLFVAVVVIGIGAKYVSDKRKAEEHWIKLKGFSGAVKRGEVTSMKPVNLSVWRFRTRKIPETTYEHLEFSIPAAYMIDTANLKGGKQQAIYLYIHAPTGDPDGLHKDIEPYTQFSVGWPVEKYYIQLTSWGIPNVNQPKKANIDFMKAILDWDGATGSKPNSYNGLYCGWHAFDETRSYNIFETHNPRAGVKSEIYFDSKDPAKWKRYIQCGDLRVCTLHTHYQRFALAINFSPLNICKANSFEKQARELLDRFLVKHYPPTRMWSEVRDPDMDIAYENSNAWTKANLNNPNIREDADK